MSDKGWLICGHGSRLEAGAQAFLRFADDLKKRNPQVAVEAGFLELSEPTYEEAIGKMYKNGVREIFAQPILLFTGVHLQHDMPAMMHEFEEKFSGLKIHLGSFIGATDEIIDLAVKRIEAACPDLDEAAKKETALLSIPVGASVPEANGDAAKLSRLIWEKSGFGFGAYGFVSRMTSPSVSEMLSFMDNLSHKRIVANPLMFFPGVYSQRIDEAVKAFQAESDKEIIITEPLESDGLLCETVEKAIAKVVSGEVDLMKTFDPEAHSHHEHHHHHHGHGHGHHHHHGHGGGGHGHGHRH
ncbi:cobalamin (vitamin B12) biosynthesis CbiX protein [Chloroherpeton thalassium ATCC 35110]|uniref:Cobalamin (Vitamin B12) biosynthesis CbiX protein n=1 Tax=Chloroherpeton thalassium (strain ATCC 35110 / GB-78) TaxID=517418 RepID=B3QW20_CHLT3|nr:sirohydrochlorin chelatase [Chloroherpeton thalassium]ACF14674.1 cobalamin (vitamin B12) biosynthesis CbiX protein [Chloroherpeton thalassium ATCC 35110]